MLSASSWIGTGGSGLLLLDGREALAANELELNSSYEAEYDGAAGI